MTHLELENLASEYLEGQLDAARHAQVEEHLSGCGSCQEMVAVVRQTIEACRSASEVAPPPWLIPRIRRATIGEPRTGFSEQLGGLLHRIRQPRLAYALAMAVFSISLLVNIAGFDLRSMSVQDLNPSTWFYRVNRAGHLVYARAEKFYDDLRIVYEIESRFRNAQSQPAEEEKHTSKPNPSPGRPASTADRGNPQLAYTTVNAAGGYAQPEQGVQTHEMR
jgi:Putative zinc-finger